MHHDARPVAYEQDGGGDARITIVLGVFAPLVGRGLVQVLEEDLCAHVLGVGLSGPVLEHALARLRPRVVILDELTVSDPLELERLQRTYPAIGVIVVAHRPSLSYGMKLLANGASCVSKDASAADILTAIRVAADGRRVYASDDGHVVERSSPDLAVALTPRETEVLEFLSRAQSHAEIAHALNLSVETVRTHSAHIRRKLGVSSNRELIGLRPLI